MSPRPLISFSMVLLCGLIPGTISAQDVTAYDGPLTAQSNTTGNWAQFWVYNVMGFQQTVSLTCYVGGAATSCSVESSIVVGPDETAIVAVFYATGDAGVGTVTLEASGWGGWDQDSHNLTVEDPPDSTPAPAVNINFFLGNEHQSLELCSESCFAVFHKQQTVPYFSKDAPRSVALAYNSDYAHPRPFVYADVSLPAGATTPQTFTLQVQDVASGNFLDFVNGQNKLWFTGTAAPVRLAGQLVIDPGLPTHVKDVRILVSANYAAETETAQLVTRLIIINESNSPIARGWVVLGVPKLFLHSDSSALVYDGATFAQFFQKCAGNCYLSPAGVWSQLRVDGSTGGFTLSAGDSSKVQFDNTGRAIRLIDRFSDTVGLHYDALGRLDQIDDPVLVYPVSPYGVYDLQRKHFELVYGANGLSEIRERRPQPGGRTTLISVSVSRTLDAVTDPDGGQTGFRYDGFGRLDKTINRRGDTTHVTHDAHSWKRTRLRLPTIPVDIGSGATAPDSVVFQYTPWQSVGVPTATTSAQSPATPANASQFLAVLKDAEGHRMTATVNRWGQPLVITDALNGVTTLTRDLTQARVISYANGSVDSITYSGMLVSSLKEAGRPRMYFRYGTRSQLDSIWGGGVQPQRIFLGSRGQVDSVRVAGLVVARYGYVFSFPTGEINLSTFRDAAQHVTRFTYGGLGNRDSTIATGKQWSSRVVDAHGRDSVLRASQRAASTVLYDPVNRIIAHHDGHNPAPTLFEHDPLYLRRVTDPKGQVFRFDVNALGWNTRIYDAADTLRFISYRYDRDGNLKSWTTRRGDTVYQRFDSLHRMVSRNGTNVVADSFAYPTRLRTEAINALSRTETFSSTENWIDSVVTILSGNRFRVRYRQNTRRLLDSVGVATSTGIAFTNLRLFWHPAVEMLDSIRVGTDVIKFGFNAERRHITTTWPGPVVRTQSLTSVHQEARTSFNNTTIENQFGRSYLYDSVGRPRSYTFKDGVPMRTNRFSYDGLGEYVADSTSTGACGSFDADYGWPCGGPSWVAGASATYDAAGNRTFGDGVPAQYGPGNRLTAEAYDLDGNQITRKFGGDSLRWDALGRLVRYRNQTIGKTVEYDYDPHGRLIRKRINGAVTRYFLWEGSRLLAELNGTASARVGEYSYVPGTLQPLALTTGSSAVVIRRFFQQDQLGNVLGVFRWGTIYEGTQYYTWGSYWPQVQTLADTNRLKWKGLVWEPEAELYYARNRWYDRNSGRFLTEDPLGIAGGLNLYEFAGNDPIGGNDPFGLQSGPCAPPKVRTPDGCVQPMPPVTVIGEPGGGGQGGAGAGGPGCVGGCGPGVGSHFGDQSCFMDECERIRDDGCIYADRNGVCHMKRGPEAFSGDPTRSASASLRTLIGIAIFTRGMTGEVWTKCMRGALRSDFNSGLMGAGAGLVSGQATSVMANTAFSGIGPMGGFAVGFAWGTVMNAGLCMYGVDSGKAIF